MDKDIALAALTGGVAVALINGIINLVMWLLNRRAKKKDDGTEDAYSRLKTIEDKVDDLAKAAKYSIFDRIRYLGQCYIDDGEIDFDDRRILNDMYKVYHCPTLKGNGDLKVLMEAVNNLPLKKRRKDKED